MSGGPEAIKNHPCGEVFVAPMPTPMGDDLPKVWDVGNAIANPYVCDSWPFEPNFLARRTPQEMLMAPCAEETEDDILEEEGKRRNPFRPGFALRLPNPGHSDDEDGDDFDGRYQGPSDTARSL